MYSPLERTTVAFFIPEWLDLRHPVVQSQIVSLSETLDALGATTAIVGCSANAGLNNAQDCQARGDKILLMKPILRHMGAIGMVIRCLWGALRAREFISSIDATHVYVRSVFSAFAAIIIFRPLGATIVFDVRSIVSAEVKGNKFKSQLLVLFEDFSLRRTDKLLTVSLYLERFIRLRSRRSDIAVVPSCPDLDMFHFSVADRTFLRKKFEFRDEHIVVCYSGGLAHWQRIDDTINLFVKLSEKDENFRFLIISRDLDIVSSKLKDSGIDEVKVKVVSADFAKVPAFLSAADVSVVLRHDVELNRAASPIKVGEYLACGLPVIFSPCVGDLSMVFSENHLAGYPLTETGRDYDALHRFCRIAKKDNSKVQARKLAEKYFDRSRYVDDYIGTFGLKTLKVIPHSGDLS